MRTATRALCALALLVAMSWPAAGDTAKPLTTILIKARAEMPDPNFRGSIVLVMNNIGAAPAGLIINRPTKVPVARLFPDIENLAHVEDKVYFGGPVALQSLWFLVRADAPPEHGVPVLDGVYLSNDSELLHKLLERDKPMEGLRIFIGYAGWGPGQLEGEIARGDWTLSPADAGTIFERKAERPWPEAPEPEGGRRT